MRLTSCLRGEALAQSVPPGSTRARPAVRPLRSVLPEGRDSYLWWSRREAAEPWLRPAVARGPPSKRPVGAASPAPRTRGSDDREVSIGPQAHTLIELA